MANNSIAIRRKTVEVENPKYKFKSCEGCSFYECELIDGYMLYKKNNPTALSFSYAPSGVEIDCCMRRWNQINCGSSRVSDGIGDCFKISMMHDYKLDGYRIEVDEDNRIGDRALGKWKPTQPVFISAQMGAGKNYFIENVLLEHVRDLNHSNRIRKKVLLLSNRLALSLQIRDRLNQGDYYKEQDEEQEIHPWKPDADVMSYQSFLNNLDRLRVVQGNQDKKAPHYIYIICDEAHFFTSDAMFNPNTERILTGVITTFQNAIRVYMSATPYECVDYIMDRERDYTTIPDAYFPTLSFYHFKHDYSYLDIKYFSDIDGIKGVVEKSGSKIG